MPGRKDQRNGELIKSRYIFGQLPPRKIATRLGLEFGLGLELVLGLEVLELFSKSIDILLLFSPLEKFLCSNLGASNFLEGF